MKLLPRILEFSNIFPDSDLVLIMGSFFVVCRLFEGMALCSEGEFRPHLTMPRAFSHLSSYESFPVVLRKPHDAGDKS